MDVFFNVLRKEKTFLIIFALCELVCLCIGLKLPIDMLLSVISSFVIVTIAHDEYNSMSEKIFSISLALFLLWVTYFAGVDVERVIVKTISAISAGFIIRPIRAFLKKTT